MNLRIKPLEWNEWDTGKHWSGTSCFFGTDIDTCDWYDVSFGCYRWSLVGDEGSLEQGDCQNLEDAKRELEAAYVKRVMEAMEVVE